jgi:hypothetical protein
MMVAIPRRASAGASVYSSCELVPVARRAASAGTPRTSMPANMATTIST